MPKLEQLTGDTMRPDDLTPYRGEFKPNWKLTHVEKIAVKLSLALYKHVPHWPGATDEQLEAVSKDILQEDIP